jgi:hypothetical protein
LHLFLEFCIFYFHLLLWIQSCKLFMTFTPQKQENKIIIHKMYLSHFLDTYVVESCKEICYATKIRKPLHPVQMSQYSNRACSWAYFCPSRQIKMFINQVDLTKKDSLFSFI